MSKYTDEQLADLTDAEREAILEDDGQPDIGTTDQLPTDDELDTQDDDAGNDANDDDDAGDDSAPAADVPPLEAQLPEDYEQRLTTLAEQKDALVAQFDDGEIGAREYQKQLDALNKQERELERIKDRAELAEDMRKQQEKREWLKDVNTFLSENPEYTENQMRYKVLDQTVREIAAAEPTLSGQEILARAHEQIQTAFGAATKGRTTPKSADKHSNPRDNAPPTLARIPAAEASGTENSKFAMLDRIQSIDPVRYERELSKLSDSDREAYLQSA